MKLNAYGKKIEIVRQENRWIVFYLGDEGKKRTAHNIFIPPDLKENEIQNYLGDLLHEWASPSNNQIVEI